MRSPADSATNRSVIVACVAAAVLAGAVVMIAYLASGRESPQQRAERGPTDVAVPALKVDGEARAGAGDTGPDEAAAGEVRAASATFRNSSFLIAIRRAGFYCDDVVMAYESADGAWVASCMDKGGYLLAVRDRDRFDVKPIPHYFDGVVPAVLIPDDREPAQRLQEVPRTDPQPRQR